MMRIIFTAMLLFTAGVTYALNPFLTPPVKAGNFYFVESTLPIDLNTGQLIVGDMETLTDAVITNIKKILHSEGLDLHDVVRTDVYLTDIRDYNAMNASYSSFFHFNQNPARDVRQVSNLLSNSRIAISCIAYSKSGH
jgi:2-iminobutanoate/2-iminopropanoate deaminase